MGKRLAVFVAVMCVVLPMWAGSAGAAHAPKFVGTYRVIDVTHDYVRKWRVDANGDVYDVTGGNATYRGSWSNDKNTFTVRYQFSADQYWFWVGQKNRRGISSRRNPGTFSVGSHPEASWYAVKLSG